MVTKTTKPPRLLTCGGGDLYILEILFTLTSMTSVEMKNAIKHYHVRGIDETLLAAMGYDIPNFRRALKVVETKAQAVEEICIKKWEKFNYGK